MADSTYTWIGLFDLFRVGIGPSSSHTVGPMIAAARFMSEIPAEADVTRLTVELFGSLALTGKGHGTGQAVVLGLLGHHPSSLDPDEVAMLLDRVAKRQTLELPGGRFVVFDPDLDVVFLKREMLLRHPNAMRFRAAGPAFDLSRTYYSVGGGFIVGDHDDQSGTLDTGMVPYPFATSGDLLRMANGARLKIAEVQAANEHVLRSDAELAQGINHIWAVMQACVQRGLGQNGVLSGRAQGAPAGARTARAAAGAAGLERA